MCFQNIRVIISSLILITSFSVSGKSIEAAPLKIAVASNFKTTMQKLVAAYQTKSSQKIILSSGATGLQFTQIINGAPYDLYFAADSEHPQKLHELGKSNRVFTYAIGQLVLWCQPKLLVSNKQCSEQLKAGEFRYLAIANPKIAPYGLAAQQTLEKLGLSIAFKSKLVKGENITQAYQYVYSGNAELGFIAASQLAKPANDNNQFWFVPEEMHQTLVQKAAVLNDSESSRDFINFLQSVEAKRIIQSFGYRVP